MLWRSWTLPSLHVVKYKQIGHGRLVVVTKKSDYYFIIFLGWMQKYVVLETWRRFLFHSVLSSYFSLTSCPSVLAFCFSKLSELCFFYFFLLFFLTKNEKKNSAKCVSGSLSEQEYVGQCIVLCMCFICSCHRTSFQTDAWLEINVLSVDVTL